jgi:hypothetical protein
VVVRRWEGAQDGARCGHANGDGAARLSRWKGACACEMSRLPFIVVVHRTGATEGLVVHNGWLADEAEHDTW